MLHRWVRLEQEGAALDVYNRHLAYVMTEDGQFVNALLVREGLARVSARVPLTRLRELQQAEARGPGVSPRHVGPVALDPAAELYSTVEDQPASDVPIQNAGVAAPQNTRKETVNATPVEYASQRKIREYNKLYYRFNHWPIWIFVFFIAPGPLTFDLFERGFDARMALWLGAVLVGTGIAGLRGALPGVEPKPYIIRFTEDRPNPLYRRVCYTFAWSEVVAFAVLNIAGLVVAIATGHWYLKQIYWYAYFPIAGTIWLLGALGAAAARQGIDQGRRARAPLFLRIGVGGVLGAAGAVAALEGRAADDRGRHLQAGRVSCDPRLRRQPRQARPFAAYPADCSRRDRRFRLGVTRGAGSLVLLI